MEKKTKTKKDLQDELEKKRNEWRKTRECYDDLQRSNHGVWMIGCKWYSMSNYDFELANVIIKDPFLVSFQGHR